MDLDFDDRDQITDYISVPAGTYRCRIADVRERLTRNDDTLWAIRLLVVEGEFTGRDAAWDNLVFSSRGLNRVKRVFQAFGLPADGKVQIAPEDLLEREAFVTVRPSEYHSAEGAMVRRNEVPYEGYVAIAESGDGAEPATRAAAAGDTDGPMPF